MTTGEGAIHSAVIYQVDAEHVIDLKALKQVRQQKRQDKKAKAEKIKEEAEFERLRKKLGKE